MITEITFEIPSHNWLTSNQRPHWRIKAEKTRNLRTLAKLKGITHARRQNIPLPIANPTHPIDITTTIHLPTNRRFDPPNAAPTIKALIDGLTDAKWWPDDNYAIIRTLTYTMGEKTGEPGIYNVTLTIKEHQ